MDHKILLGSIDRRFEGLIDDLETLFNAYLKTWINSNTEILGILKKEKQR